MGLNYLFDITAINQLLSNNNLPVQKRLFKGASASISVITTIEYNSNPILSSTNKHLFKMLIDKAQVLDLKYKNNEPIQKVITLRKKYNLKTQDAIIASQAIINDLLLVTNDGGFTKNFGLQIEQI